MQGESDEHANSEKKLEVRQSGDERTSIFDVLPLVAVPSSDEDERCEAMMQRKLWYRWSCSFLTYFMTKISMMILLKSTTRPSVGSISSCVVRSIPTTLCYSQNVALLPLLFFPHLLPDRDSRGYSTIASAARDVGNLARVVKWYGNFVSRTMA